MKVKKTLSIKWKLYLKFFNNLIYDFLTFKPLSNGLNTSTRKTKSLNKSECSMNRSIQQECPISTMFYLFDSEILSIILEN